MLKQISIAAIALCASLTMSAQAATIPYPDIGTPAPANTFTAEADGDIVAFFYASSAAYKSRIGVKINGAAPVTYGLVNHDSTYGDSIVLGSALAGQSLEFELQVLGKDLSWFSVAAYNIDLKNHAYATAFGGDADIDAGTYIGFEDLPYLGDLDYNDHQFVFSNVKYSNVPEPAGLVLLGLGLLALGYSRKRMVN